MLIETMKNRPRRNEANEDIFLLFVYFVSSWFLFRRNNMKSLIPAAILFFCSISGLAQAPSPSTSAPQITLNEQTRREVIETALSALNINYVFPETAQKMEAAIRGRMARGEYDRITDPRKFARMLQEHLQEVSRDKHLLIFFYWPAKVPSVNADKGLPPELQAQRLAEFKRENYGFAKVEQLEGNIGYLDLRRFVQPVVAGETAAAAMNFLHYTDALIIDLRQNQGGSPVMVALLCSYFFGKRTHLNDIYWRPENETRESWTSESVAGKRYGDKPVWLLTSKRTFSAAEEFAYDLKALKRAMTVGETTGGGAHTTRLQRLHDHIGMLTPVGKAINPITKTNWEGAGVQPDLAAPASDALRVAHAAAVRKAIEQVTDQARRRELQDLLMELEVPAKPAPADDGGLGLPKTPAGDALRSFLLALNSGDIGRLRHFHRTRGADVSSGRRDYERLFQPSGGLKTHSIVTSSDHRIEVLAQFKKEDTWKKLSVEVEPIAPYRVRIGVSDAEPPAKQPRRE
jgi:retinol-binding protein 3